MYNKQVKKYSKQNYMTTTTIRMTASECRDPMNWRRSYYKTGDRMTVSYNIIPTATDPKNEKWVEIFEIKPTSHGKGLFSLVEFRNNSPVCPYPGRLYHESESPQQHSSMVMQSGIKQLYVVADKFAWSGGSFVNDARGTNQSKNVKISLTHTLLRNRPDQLEMYKRESLQQGGKLTGLHPQAVGLTLPIYRSTRVIKVGDQLLTSYNWTTADWNSAISADANNTKNKKRKRNNNNNNNNDPS